MKLMLRIVFVIPCIILAACDDQKTIGDEAVHLVSWGGQFQTDLMRLWVEPAAEKAGVKIVADAWDGDYSALSTRIHRGINSWDLVHVEAHYLFPPKNESRFTAKPGLKLPLIRDDVHVQQDVKRLIEQGIAWPILQYGYILASNDLSPDELTWANFFDSSKISGRRGIRDFPIGNIEIALLAEGRDPVKDLYEAPEKDVSGVVEEALRTFDKIASDISWWKNGDTLQSGLTSKEYRMAAAWSGRVLSALRSVCPDAEDQVGCTLKFTGENALVSTDWWVIPKNASNAAAASRLIEALYSDDAGMSEGAKNFSEQQGYLAPVRMAIDGVAEDSKEILKVGSSQNNRSVHISEYFWSRNFDTINKAWLDWRARTQR